MTTTIRQPVSVSSTSRLVELTGTAAIQNIVLDGNRSARGWPGGFDWQQSCNAYLHDGTFAVTGVRLLNSPGDGVLVGANATVDVESVTSVDCFRGAITMVGGNSTATLTDIDGDWLHIEIDTLGTGDLMTVDVTATNCSFPRGVELESWGAIEFADCDLGVRFWLLGEGGGAATFTDCTIGLGGADDAIGPGFEYVTSSIYYPRDVTFTRCAFTGGPLNLYPEVLSATFEDQHITFVDCTFTGSGAQAVYNYGNSTDLGNTIEFVRCTYSGFDAGYVLRDGFYATLVGTLDLA